MSAKKREPKDTEIELRPDGWERFGKAVDAAVKSGPKHRPPRRHKDEPSHKRQPSKAKNDR
jgi:hypothetical protein